ncbi:calpain-7-like [Planococcus citri]|uniref:calpain-7-like n=1 Tax=Planococcus citri TaxID=170843 RepID=UPI0031F80884
MDYAEDAIKASTRAVECDTKGEYRLAVYYYKQAMKLLELAYKEEPDHPDAVTWCKKTHEYADRSHFLQYQIDSEIIKRSKSVEESKNLIQLKQCHFLLKQALDADESGLKESALELYTRAVDLAISTKKEIDDQEMVTKLKKIACQALERAEQLKEEVKKVTVVPQNREPSTPKSEKVSHSVLHRGNSVQLKVSGNDTYSEEEKRVLLATSRINRHEFVPFMTIDLDERFQYAIPFTDKDGLLILSPNQKQHFQRWARPHEFCADPKMVVNKHVNYLTIKQTIVSDCSFVASLAVAAQYEQKFDRRIVTSIIFPKKRTSEPVYNPFGKYMVKFHLNGISRKVIIDDQLPLGKHNELLCSYSTNDNEIWISLLEKAYMKVMGGYNFPGSNSNIDLHALTGWIPERCAIRTQDPDFNSEALFNILLTRLHKGDVLVTVATGELSPADENRTGLVPTHAYAVLDVRKVKNYRLLKLKNPWSHIRWRGNFSELDLSHWTDDLKQALDFDPYSASTFDNGIFWIDYDSVLRFFDVFYMNWNPELFSHTFCIHQSWSAGRGPVKDNYNISENPQFLLDVQNAKSGAVWILLTRHITELEDFKDNREYITVMVYKNDGKKVYYPNDPEPFITGIRINSPHYLCKIVLGENSPRFFTLVVSQYEKMNTIYYTLRVYSTCPFVLDKFPNYYKYEQKIKDGQWAGISAGGCRNHPATYDNNPIYQVDLSSNHDNNYLIFDLKGPKQYQLGLEVSIVKLYDENATAKFKRVSSGDYRPGFVVLEVKEAQPGLYNVIPSTYLPQQEGPFILTVKSSSPVTISRMK